MDSFRSHQLEVIPSFASLISSTDRMGQSHQFYQLPSFKLVEAEQRLNYNLEPLNHLLLEEEKPQKTTTSTPNKSSGISTTKPVQVKEEEEINVVCEDSLPVLLKQLQVSPTAIFFNYTPDWMRIDYKSYHLVFVWVQVKGILVNYSGTLTSSLDYNSFYKILEAHHYLLSHKETLIFSFYEDNQFTSALNDYFRIQNFHAPRHFIDLYNFLYENMHAFRTINIEAQVHPEYIKLAETTLYEQLKTIYLTPDVIDFTTTLQSFVTPKILPIFREQETYNKYLEYFRKTWVPTCQIWGWGYRRRLIFQGSELSPVSSTGFLSVQSLRRILQQITIYENGSQNVDWPATIRAVHNYYESAVNTILEVVSTPSPFSSLFKALKSKSNPHSSNPIPSSSTSSSSLSSSSSTGNSSSNHAQFKTYHFEEHVHSPQEQEEQWSPPTQYPSRQNSPLHQHSPPQSYQQQQQQQQIRIGEITANIGTSTSSQMVYVFRANSEGTCEGCGETKTNLNCSNKNCLNCCAKTNKPCKLTAHAAQKAKLFPSQWRREIDMAIKEDKSLRIVYARLNEVTAQFKRWINQGFSFEALVKGEGGKLEVKRFRLDKIENLKIVDNNNNNSVHTSSPPTTINNKDERDDDEGKKRGAKRRRIDSGK